MFTYIALFTSTIYAFLLALPQYLTWAAGIVSPPPPRPSSASFVAPPQQPLPSSPEENA